MALIRKPIPDVEEEFRAAEEKRLNELAKALEEQKRAEKEASLKSEEDFKALHEEELKRLETEKDQEPKAVQEWFGPLPRPDNERKTAIDIAKEDVGVKDAYMKFKRVVDELCNDLIFLDKMKNAKRVRYELIDVLDHYDDFDEGPKDDRYTMMQDRCVELEELNSQLGNHNVFYLLLQKLQSKTNMDMDICEFYEPNEIRIYREMAMIEKMLEPLYDMCLAGEPAMCACNGAWKSRCPSRLEYASKVTEKAALGKLL